MEFLHIRSGILHIPLSTYIDFFQLCMHLIVYFFVFFNKNSRMYKIFQWNTKSVHDECICYDKNK